MAFAARSARFWDNVGIPWAPLYRTCCDVGLLKPGQENFRHRILLAFAQWTSSKARQLDDHVPLQNHMPNVHCSTSLNNYVNQEHAGIADAAISEFIYHVAIRLLGPDAACFGNALGGFFARGGFSALRGDGTSSALSEYPALVLSLGSEAFVGSV